MCKSALFTLFACISLTFQLTQAVSVQKLLLTYEAQVNTSLLMEKQDIQRIKTWSEDFQVKLVDVTAQHRMQVSSHQTHSFEKQEANDEWKLCLKLYQNETTRAEQIYYVRENECLRIASSAGDEKRQAIMQIGREIRKWRRSYRYLTKRCHTEHPGNVEKAEICLVNYMEKDNYSHAFKRLISLRLQAVQILHEAFQKSLQNLERCLDNQFSKYLEQIRIVMNTLNKCYSNRVRN